ncbi:MAG: CPBP family intramembrane metalloprotease [Clostridia bacterium]|nr:CPBP family intramembrane metalloprotease [Clostridia bacterium]
MTNKRYELRKQIKSVRWMIFWVVLAQLAAEMAVEALLSFMKNPPHQYVQIALVEVLAIGVPIIVYARSVWTSSGKDAKQEFWLNRCGVYFIVLAALLGICGQFVMILLNMPANIFTKTVLEQTGGDAVVAAQNGAEVFLGIIGVVIIPAVLEEFWMRGIIFSAYNKSNTFAAIFFTSIIFALLHLRINEALGFLLMGIVASFVLIKSRSIYAAMIYHAFSNLTALMLTKFILPILGDYIWFVFIAASVGFVLLFALLMLQKNKVSINKNFGTRGLVFGSIFSLPVILSAAVVVLKYFLINFIG